MGKDRKNQKLMPYKKLVYVIIGTSFVFLVSYWCLHQSNQISQLNHSQGPTPKAAIVDHLSISHPNQAFVQECSAILKGSGFTVDYYRGEKVTVEFYRNLPTYDYDLVVFRVHSTYIHKYLSLAMFTSEPYSTEGYVYEQLRNRVACGYLEPYGEGDPRYLVVTDKFVRFSMKGLFKDTVIIMMGCTGIKRCMATAFLKKGAKAYIGWDGLVSAPHTDQATIQLLKYLLEEGQIIATAVGKTMRDVGQESQYHSSLLFWPIEAGNHSVHTINSRISKYLSTFNKSKRP